MLDVNIGRDLVEVACLCVLLDLFPVLLTVPLDWFLPILEWAFQTGVLLHTVAMGPVVDLDRLEVSPAAMLLESRQTRLIFEVQEELNMDGTFCPLLQLPYHVLGLALHVPCLEVLLCRYVGIIECT